MQYQPVTAENTDLSTLVKDYNSLREDYLFLKQELEALKRMVFGRKSERFIPTDPGQLVIEMEGAEQVKEPEKQLEKVSYSREKKKSNGKAIRLALPAHLPRQTEIIDPENLAEGAKKIGQEITEILEYNPGRLYVRRIERTRYVQEEQIKIAELPSLPIPQGNAGPGLLAHLLISKFVDHLPFYRQVQQFKREGVKIAESTINGWFNASCSLLEPLYEVLRQKIQRTDYLMADETPIAVQSSQKKGATHTGYHWVYYSPKEKLVCFDYNSSRSREGPEAFLKNFSGALQSDGYVAYDIFENNPQITMLGCMAHARRYFEKAKDSDRERSEYALGKIQELYAIERQAKEQEMNSEQRFEFRKDHSLLIIKALEEWLEDQAPQVLPRSAIGKAIAYNLRLWKRLKRYTTNGEWNIDNNWVENSIRPVALGRKNYLFAGSHSAAQQAAILYSFLGTCKINKVEPFQWLKNTLEKIPDCKVNDLEKLLPVKKLSENQ